MSAPTEDDMEFGSIFYTGFCRVLALVLAVFFAHSENVSTCLTCARKFFDFLTELDADADSE